MPPGQTTNLQGSSLQAPLQHFWLAPHCVPRHMLLTHMPTPLVMAQIWPAEQCTLAQGSAWHMPSTQRSPIMQVAGHSGTQLPLSQYSVESQVTLAQGLSTHAGGVPVQIWPSGQGKLR